MLWYHGTSVANRDSILRTWFQKSGGTWGEGIYFSSSLDGALLFGETILQAVIPDQSIRMFTYEEWQFNHPDEDDWSDIMQSFGCQAIAMRYSSGEIELCVNDPQVIQLISNASIEPQCSTIGL